MKETEYYKNEAEEAIEDNSELRDPTTIYWAIVGVVYALLFIGAQIAELRKETDDEQNMPRV